MEILLYLLKSSLLLVIFLLFYRFFLSKETFYTFNRWFLLLGWAGAFLLPGLVFTRTVLVDPVTLPIFPLAEINAEAVLNSAETAAYDFWQIALILYCVGTVGFLLYFGHQLTTLLFYLKKQPFSAKKGLFYVEIEGVSAPFSFMNYVVYDPQAHTSSELQLILQHERAHAKQLHSQDILLGRLCCAVLWFNPFCWLYFRSMEENLEFLADASVKGNEFSAKRYQLALLKNATGTKVPQFAQSFYKSFIKKRIMMLNTAQSHSNNRFKVLFILPFLAVFLWSFNVREVKIMAKNDQKTTISTQKPVKNAKNWKEKAFRFEIAPTATEAEIEALATQLKKDYNVQLKLDYIVYDETGTIIGIKLEMKDLRNKNVSKVNLKNTEGLGTIVLFRSEQGTLGFTSEGSSSTTSIQSTRNARISSKTNGDSVYFDRPSLETQEKALKAQRTALEQRREALEHQRAVLDEQQKNLEKQQQEMDKILQERTEAMKKRSMNASTIQNEQQHVQKDSLNDNVLYLVDGEEITKEKMNLIKPEEIQSMNVIKDSKTLKKYGEKAKNGVVEIKLKKDKE